MKIVGRIMGIDAASGIGEIVPEGGGSMTTVFAADLEAAGIEPRPGVRLVFSIGTRGGATCATDLERFYPRPADGELPERGVDLVMDQFIDMVTTVKSREVAVKSREQSAIQWERRNEQRQRELTALESAVLARLQGVEARESEAKGREEKLDAREAALRTAEERHSVARKP